jgi:LemA protein
MEGISIVLVGALAVIVTVALIRIFNRLIAARNACANARSGIDANLAKRHDLIPNLVSVVRAYAEHEQETLRIVSQARAEAIARLGSAGSPLQEDQLTRSLVTLHARVEAYPELKASEEFARLQRTLTEIEEQISASRRAFNAQVMINNNLVQQFPTSIIARAAGITMQNFFSAGSVAAAGVPSVAERD